MLYGKNDFTLDWAYCGTELSILEFLQDIGTKNRQLIRHLRARHFSIFTLDKIRAQRDLRPILENLDSLSLEFYDGNRSIDNYGSAKKNPVTILQDVQRYLKMQRGPYRKLVKAFKIAVDCPAYDPILGVRLASAAIKPGPKVRNLPNRSIPQC